VQIATGTRPRSRHARGNVQAQRRSVWVEIGSVSGCTLLRHAAIAPSLMVRATIRRPATKGNDRQRTYVESSRESRPQGERHDRISRDEQEGARGLENVGGIPRQISSVDRLVLAYSTSFPEAQFWREQFLPLHQYIRLEIELQKLAAGFGHWSSRVRARTRRTPARAEAGGDGGSVSGTRPGGLSRLDKLRCRQQHEVGRGLGPRHAADEAIDVLIVDDEKVFGRARSSAFRERGDKVRTVLDGLPDWRVLKRPPTRLGRTQMRHGQAGAS